MNIKQIYDQLFKCNFFDEVGNDIKNNVAFLQLGQIAKINYQPKFALNEKVVHKGLEKYVFALRAKESSYPFEEVEYLLSVRCNRSSTSNVAESNSWTCETELFTREEWDKRKVENAISILKDLGYCVTKL